MRDLYEAYIKRIDTANKQYNDTLAKATASWQDAINLAFADMITAMEMRVSSLFNGPQPADKPNASRTVGTEAVKQSLLPVDKEFSSDRRMKSAWGEPRDESHENSRGDAD